MTLPSDDDIDLLEKAASAAASAIGTIYDVLPDRRPTSKDYGTTKAEWRRVARAVEAVLSNNQ